MCVKARRTSNVVVLPDQVVMLLSYRFRQSLTWLLATSVVRISITKDPVEGVEMAPGRVSH
jgi:hypothetical protein